MVVHTEAYEGSGTAAPSDLCSRYCSMLRLDQKATNVAIQLASKVTSSGSLAGRSPLSQAAACIYMAGYLMGQPKNAKDIQMVAHVSDSTIRQAYRLLFADKDKIITADLLARGADPSQLPKPS